MSLNYTHCQKLLVSNRLATLAHFPAFCLLGPHGHLSTLPILLPSSVFPSLGPLAPLTLLRLQLSNLIHDCTVEPGQEEGNGGCGGRTWEVPRSIKEMSSSSRPLSTIRATQCLSIQAGQEGTLRNSLACLSTVRHIQGAPRVPSLSPCFQKCRDMEGRRSPPGQLGSRHREGGRSYGNLLGATHCQWC